MFDYKLFDKTVVTLLLVTITLTLKRDTIQQKKHKHTSIGLIAIGSIKKKVLTEVLVAALVVRFYLVGELEKRTYSSSLPCISNRLTVTPLHLSLHSKRGPESIFYIQSEDILTKRGQNFSPRFVTRCTVLTLP